MSPRALIFAAAVCLAAGGVDYAAAQAGGSGSSAPADAATPATVVPRSLELSESQRHVLFTSISSKTHVSTAAPANFLPRLGEVVPSSVEMQPIPDAAAELIPALRGYQCALIANQALIVDPKTRQIIEIVSEGKDVPASPSRG